jgi:hypothetical protein
VVIRDVAVRKGIEPQKFRPTRRGRLDVLLSVVLAVKPRPRMPIDGNRRGEIPG